MELKEWLKQKKISGKDFADRLNVSEQTVSRYCRQIRIPKAKIIQEIVRLTNGEVGYADFYAAEDATKQEGIQ